MLAGNAQAAATAVPLGTADSFAVLAGAGITNTGATTINGDVGTYPTTTMTGTSTLTVNGTNHVGDGVTQQAKTDLTTAYNVAAGEAPPSPIVADLGGQTLTPGVYNSASSIGLTGALTLDAGGNPNAVFVFQAGSTLTTASASSVVLLGQAQPCNVFWQVGSSATLGTGSSFRGSILALTDITLTTGATVDGRVLARNGAVTLNTNTVTTSTCAAVTPTPTSSSSTTTSPTPTSSSSSSTTTSPTPASTSSSSTTTSPTPASTSSSSTTTSPTPTSSTTSSSTTTTPAISASPTTPSTATSTATPPVSLQVAAGGGAEAGRSTGPALLWGAMTALGTLLLGLPVAWLRRRRSADRQ